MRNTAERNALVEKNYRLVTFCVKKLNFGKFDEDLFQTGCFGLIEAAERYDETKGAFSTFAVSRIHYKLLEFISRKQKKIKENEVSSIYELNGGYTDIINIIADGNDVISHADNNILLEQIMSMLPKRERTILELYKNGKTQTAIAKELGTYRADISHKSIMREVFGFDQNHVYFFHRENEEYITPPHIDEVKLMQCTGLRDINDTLIFEGDIVVGSNEYEISDVIWKDGVSQRLI